MDSLFQIPYIYKQNIFNNLKLDSYGKFEYNVQDMADLGTLNYFDETHQEDISDPYSPEE
jgi:hypothetical protein